MTVIVGFVKDRAVWMGGDTQGSNGWEKMNRVDKKVFERHGIIYGFTSSYRMGQILQYHSTKVAIDKEDVFGSVVTKLVPMWKKILIEHGFAKTENGAVTGGVFMVGIGNRLFTIDSDMQVAESRDKYAAVGCGAQYALGAMHIQTMYGVDGDHRDMHPEEYVRHAIEAAMKFSNGCGGSIDVINNGGKFP